MLALALDVNLIVNAALGCLVALVVVALVSRAR